MKKRILLLAGFFVLLSSNYLSLSAQSVGVECKINPLERRQTLEGWGVSLCWWANMCGKWSDDKIDTLVNWLVSPEGLNYNVFRYNIGGGDDPLNRNCNKHHMGAKGGKGLRAEMDGFKVYEQAAYDWSADEGQRKIMLKIREKRPDAIFEAFSNSAPWWMTYSGCCSGNEDPSKDNLRPEYYNAFARYLVDVCQYYKDTYQIEFHSLDPFNEPLSSYWNRNGGQEGCHFDVNSQISFLKVLAPLLKQSGLRTVISASDDTNLGQSISAFQAYTEDHEVLSLIGQWNTHTYSGSNDERNTLRKLAKDKKIPLWMSESGAGGKGISGNLAMSQTLMNDIRYLRPTVWCDWQYVEEWTDQWNMVRAVFREQQYEKVKNYAVRQQITRFIKRGYTFIETNNEQILAAISPANDSLVVVCQNNAETAVSYSINLESFDKVALLKTYTTDVTRDCVAIQGGEVRNKKINVSLPATGIQTLVLRIKQKRR